MKEMAKLRRRAGLTQTQVANARGKTLQEAGEAAGYPAKTARQSADEAGER